MAPLEGRLAHRPEGGMTCRAALGMTQEQESARRQDRGEPVEDAQLDIASEIDHHVAAEHDIEVLVRRPGRRKEIARSEFDHRTKIGPHEGFAGIRPGAFQEMLAYA